VPALASAPIPLTDRSILQLNGHTGYPLRYDETAPGSRLREMYSPSGQPTDAGRVLMECAAALPKDGNSLTCVRVSIAARARCSLLRWRSFILKDLGFTRARISRLALRG
jgi:hypothetical protein